MNAIQNPVTREPVDQCRDCEDREFCVCHVKVCNCARCGKLLTDNPLHVLFLRRQGHRDANRLAGRVDDRPYCGYCIPISRMPDEVAVHFHNHRTPRQRARMGGICG